ncbi:PREDICTED: eukaryotic translation initiation factor 2D [Ceratosolen solmsi marchali]|uniref:Eukaryotic translation initiation factor 2D n=1 Tax=Ceratosolen solmsi marchali TaxID=326594 RepID=A0AAJ6VMG5_9HYME|nr:PREDICTED: eukaryotic translation initiation factor 2D [Ceratosolen solmsi marchali]
MFIKPFKIRSNNQLKETERKKLCDEVGQNFPSLKNEEIKNLLPKKESVSILKIITHNAEMGKIYCNAKVPLFFQLNSQSELFPTLFTLWHHPNLLYSYTIKSPIVSKLANGANLMLPGVVVDNFSNFHCYGKLKKGALVSIITDDNVAPIAIGLTARSSEDMYMSAGSGKCVDIVHVIGDYLYNIDKPLVRPKLGPPTLLRNESKIRSFNESTISIQRQIANDIDGVSVDIDNINIITNKNDETNIEAAVNDLKSNSLSNDLLNDNEKKELIYPLQKMDKLLEYCFFKACKVSLKKEDLPLITSTFFKNHIISACPTGSTVDVKKSSYKKLSVFLANMKAKGLIETSILKGVETLLSVKYDHPLIQNFIVMEESVSKESEMSNAPVISECFRVTAPVVPILFKFGYEKGDIIRRPEIRKCFTEYIKIENLQNGKLVKINPQLADVLRTKENQQYITIEDGINKFIGKMTHTHEITVAGNKILHSGKLEPIDITVVTRSHCKKVTLINNLETFGIKLEDFSKECQVIGASATITNVSGKKTPSVLVQGNQVLYVYKLLSEKYHINKNHIKGLEFAPKKKK